MQGAEKQKQIEIELVKREKDAEMSQKEISYKQQIKVITDDRDYWHTQRHSLDIKSFGTVLENGCDNLWAKFKNFLPNATFVPDTASGEKADRIYREHDGNGNPALSISFEMKWDRDDTDEKNRKKNNDKEILKKLDRNRKQRDCEYAVLVSLLEADNENYDAPFLVSEYEKMFVIRPQHFRYIIENLRLIKSELAHAQMKLAEIKKQNADFTNFQSNWKEYLEDVDYNINLARKHFAALRKKLEDEIDDKRKQIDALDAVGRNLDLALRKAKKVDFQKMAKDSPALLLQFTEELSENTKGKKTS